MLHTAFIMRIYYYSSLAFLLLAFLLFNCSSQRVAFEFSPDKVNHRRAVPVASEAVVPAASANWQSTATVATLAAPSSRPEYRRRAVPFAARPRRVPGKPAAFVGKKAAPRPAGDFNPSEFLSQPSTERGSLIAGASTGALGVALNYAAITSSSRTLLLTTGHYLLWLSAALLLFWFIMKLLKARKE